MDKNTSHDAALKLINDIALIDTELAAKIKPSIDMFIESISNNDVWNQLAEVFKLKTKEERKKWWDEHKELGAKIQSIHASMNKATTALNEDTQKPLENGETKTDGPVQSDVKKDEKKKDKEEEVVDEEQPTNMKIPEDGFKDDKVTVPLLTTGDDKRFFGKKADDLPKPEDMDPNKKPEIIDGNKGQVAVVELPDYTKRTPQIELNFESARKFLDDKVLESIKVKDDSKVVKESVENKYREFLDQCQLDWAQTNVENGTVRPGIAKFVPIRKYATQLYKQFKDDFASYDDAMAVAKEWYATLGRRTREADRILPAPVFVELRKTKNSNFVVNVYLVKSTDLNMTDAEMASDLFSAYTDEFVDDKPADKIWIKLPKQVRTPEGPASVYMIYLPFPKENKKGIVLSRIKHDIVNQIRADYKDYYLPTTRIPSWVYSQVPMESLTEAKDVDYKQIYKDVIKQIFFNDYYFEDADEGFDEEAAKEYIINKIPERLEYYCDIMDIDFVEASNALDEKDIEDLVDDFMFSIDTEGVNESESFEFVEDDVDYNDEMQQVIDGLCEDYIDEWIKGKTTEKPVDFVLDRLNKEATLQAKLNDFDADEFINSFTIDELKKMIEVIMAKKWQDKEDLEDAIDHDMHMRESVEVNESVEYKHSEVDELAEEFIADLQELGDNPWDMDVAEFIEWAWGRGNVPREEIPYISKRWDIFRTLYAR